MTILRILCLLSCGALAQAAPSPTPQDFAYGLPLRAEGNEAMYRLALPLAVYQGVTRSDLGDMRVFNAAGEVVPHALREESASQTAQASTISLPFFPVHAAPGEPSSDALALEVERNASGTIVRLKTAEPAAAQRPIVSYLIDTSQLEQALAALQLDWRQSEANFIGAVKVEGSDDLKNWRVLTDAAPIVRMQAGANRLNDARVELIDERHKYLRLSWPAQQPALALTQVQGEPSARSVDAPRLWAQFPGQAVAKRSGEYSFTLDVRAPIDRLRVTLPQDNTVVAATLLTREDDQQAWRELQRTTLYRLNRAGTQVNSPDLRLGRVEAREWLLRVDESGGGLGSGTPTLQVGWRPHQAVFVARGAAPFQLAFGSGVIAPNQTTPASIVPGYEEKVFAALKVAQAGERITLGGDERLRATPPFSWRTWSLWAVLIVGALVLGWMAYQLTRQMGASGGKRKTEDVDPS